MDLKVTWEVSPNDRVIVYWTFEFQEQRDVTFPTGDYFEVPEKEEDLPATVFEELPKDVRDWIIAGNRPGFRPS
jgi:hypothetical protein